MIVVIVIPIALAMPPVISAAPIAVIGIPATLAFRVQVATATLCLGAMFSMMTNRVVQPRLSLLNSMLAFGVIIIGLHLGYAGEQQCRA